MGLIDPKVIARSTTLNDARRPTITQDDSALRRVSDLGIDAAKSAIGLGQSIVGVADLATGGYVGDAMRGIGYDPEAAKGMLEEGYSTQRKRAEGAVRNSEGFVGKATAMIDNPSTILGRAVESSAQLLGSAAAAKSLVGSVASNMAKTASARGLTGQAADRFVAKATEQYLRSSAGQSAIKWAAAGGDAALTAGSVAQDIRSQNPDDVSAMYNAVPAGLVTGVISRIGSKFDGGGVEAAIGSGGRAGAIKGSLPVRAAKGFLGEGIEEGIQSPQEQMWTNDATGRPILEGTGEAAAEGILAGGLAGAGFSAMSRQRNMLPGANDQSDVGAAITGGNQGTPGLSGDNVGPQIDPATLNAAPITPVTPPTQEQVQQGGKKNKDPVVTDAQKQYLNAKYGEPEAIIYENGQSDGVMWNGKKYKRGEEKKLAKDQAKLFQEDAEKEEGHRNIEQRLAEIMREQSGKVDQKELAKLSKFFTGAVDEETAMHRLLDPKDAESPYTKLNLQIAQARQTLADLYEDEKNDPESAAADANFPGKRAKAQEALDKAKAEIAVYDKLREQLGIAPPPPPSVESKAKPKTAAAPTTTTETAKTTESTAAAKPVAGTFELALPEAEHNKPFTYADNNGTHTITQLEQARRLDALKGRERDQLSMLLGHDINGEYTGAIPTHKEVAAAVSAKYGEKVSAKGVSAFARRYGLKAENLEEAAAAGGNMFTDHGSSVAVDESTDTMVDQRDGTDKAVELADGSDSESNYGVDYETEDSGHTTAGVQVVDKVNKTNVADNDNMTRKQQVLAIAGDIAAEYEATPETDTATRARLRRQYKIAIQQSNNAGSRAAFADEGKKESEKLKTYFKNLAEKSTEDAPEIPKSARFVQAAVADYRRETPVGERTAEGMDKFVAKRSKELEVAERQRSIDSDRITAANRENAAKLAMQLQAEQQRIASERDLKSLFPDAPEEVFTEAQEAWDEDLADGDAKWDTLGLADQSDLVRTTIALRTKSISAKAYNEKYERKLNEIRDKQSRPAGDTGGAVDTGADSRISRTGKQESSSVDTREGADTRDGAFNERTESSDVSKDQAGERSSGEVSTSGETGKQASVPVIKVKKSRKIPKVLPSKAVKSDTQQVIDSQLVDDEFGQDELLQDIAESITTVLDTMRSNGLGSVADSIANNIHTGKLGDGHQGIVFYADGEYHIVIDNDIAQGDSQTQQEVITHEIGHVVDMAAQGGIYSHSPSLHFRFDQDGKLVAQGAVAREVAQYFKSGKTSLAKEFAYPLDTKRFSEFEGNSRHVQMEVFSQLWMLYNSDATTRATFEADLPLAAKFLEGVMNHAGQETTGRVHGEKKTARAVRAERKQSFQNTQNTKGGERGATGDTQRAQGSERSQGVILGSKRGAIVDQNIARLPAPLQSPIHKFFDTISNWAKSGIYVASFTQDLLEKAKTMMPSAEKYARALEAKEKVRRDIEAKVMKIMTAADELTTERKKVVSKFLMDSTRSAKWAYVPAHMPTATVDPALEARFNALQPKERDVVKAIFAHGHEIIVQKQAILEKEIRAEYADQIKNDPANTKKLEKERDKQLSRYVDRLRKMDGPYAPLKRFGSHVVVARSKAFMDAYNAKDTKAMRRMESDEAHNLVRFVDTYAEAKALERELKTNTNYTPDGVQAFEKDQGHDAIYGDNSNMFDAFRRIKTMIQDEKGRTSKRLNRLVSDLYLTTMSDISARRSEMARKNISGADEDMLKAFVTQGNADAGFISALSNNNEVIKELAMMKSEADQHRTGREEATKLLNELLVRHADRSAVEQTPVQDKLMAGTSLWMLATSPAYYITNAMQTEMVTVPFLAGRFGGGKAHAAVFNAYKQLIPTMKGGEMDVTKLSGPEQAMIGKLEDIGLIDNGTGADFGRWMRDGSESKVMANVVDKVRGFAGKVEHANRIVAAVAAYRLAVESGLNPDKATEYARSAVLRTHGDYSGFNAPRFMRNSFMPGAKLITQFRKYQIIQLSLLGRLMRESFNGADQKERAAARATLTWMFGHTAVMAGALGLPLVNGLGYVLAKAFGDGDEPEDFELMARRAIDNKPLADLLLGGVPKALGMGITNKVGMDKVFSIMPYTEIDLTSRKGVEKTVVGLMGPGVSLAARAADGIDMIGKGDYYKGLEQLMPSGLANAAKGIRYGTEGLTQRNGDTVIPAEDISLLESLMVGVGYQPNVISDRTRNNTTLRNFETKYKERVDTLIHEYTQASKSGDSDKMSEIRESWQKLQQSQRANGFTVSPLSTLLRSPIEQRKRERATDSGVEYSKHNRKFVESIPD